MTFFGRIYVTKCSQDGAGRDTKDAEWERVAGLQNGLRKAPEGAARREATPDSCLPANACCRFGPLSYKMQPTSLHMFFVQ